MKRSWLLGMTFLLGGCTAMQPLSHASVLMIQPEILPGKLTQAQVDRYSKDSIHHLTIRLFTVNGETEQDLGFSKTLTGGQVDSPVVFTSLSANTQVRIKAFAYASSDDSQLISTVDDRSYTDLVITNDDRPSLTRLKVQLIDKPFDAAFPSSVDFYPIFLPSGSESISVFNRGVVSDVVGSTSTGAQDGRGTAARFGENYGITADDEGYLYLADSANHLIRKVAPSGMVTTLAGNQTPNLGDGVGTQAAFRFPTGIALNAAKDLFVADSQNNAIRKITSAGLVMTFAGGAAFGSQDGNGTAAGFHTPIALTLDQAGNLYVSDSDNHLIRKISPSGDVTTLAGNGVSSFSDGNGTLASFSYPRGIVCDEQGNLFVADSGNHRIRKITALGVVSTLAGKPSSGFTDGNGSNAAFNSPDGLGIDSKGNLFVADFNNHAIRKITPQGDVSTFAGGVNGYANGTGTAARFYLPTGLVMAPYNVLYVLDKSLPIVRKIE